MATKIPIENIYYLLGYAWDQLDEAGLVDISRLSTTSLPNLFTSLLCGGLDHIVRRGMEQVYELREDELSGIRGRPLLVQSARRMLLMHGRALCTFDELTVNSLPNRIIKSTLKYLCRATDLDENLLARSRAYYRSLKEINDVQLTSNLIACARPSSNVRYYRFLLNICEVIYSCVSVDERTGDVRFRDFIRDPKRMAALFQRFLFSFIRKRCPTWTARREHISWDAGSATDPALTLLPRMETDISLTRGNEHVIVDAKYYQETLSERFDAQKYHSAHLYQLLSYVLNRSTFSDKTISGLLVYPQVEPELKQTYQILGHKIRVCTVDLNQPWQRVEAELCSIFQ